MKIICNETYCYRSLEPEGGSGSYFWPKKRRLLFLANKCPEICSNLIMVPYRILGGIRLAGEHQAAGSGVDQKILQGSTASSKSEAYLKQIWYSRCGRYLTRYLSGTFLPNYLRKLCFGVEYVRYGRYLGTYITDSYRVTVPVPVPIFIGTGRYQLFM